MARFHSEVLAAYETSKSPVIMNALTGLAAKITILQQLDDLWRVRLLDLDSFPGGEASGTGFYVYGLAWSINNKLLEQKTYLPAIKKGWTEIHY